MSKFAPTNGDSTPATKFGELEILAEGPFSAKNGVQYFKLTLNITPWIDAENPPANADEMKVRSWKMVTAKWNAEYTEVFWPSIVNGNSKQGYALQPHLATVLKSADDLFTEPGQPSKRFFISYQTPLLLVSASADDIQYAKDHDRMESLVLNSIGQAQKKRYPVKIIQIYADMASWEAAAKANASQQPIQAPQPNPERDACLAALESVFVGQWLVKADDGSLKDVDMFKLEADLQNPPFNKYFTLHSPEVKALIAQAVVARTGRNMEALKGLLLTTDGFLDIESAEVKAALEEVAF